MLDDLSGLQRSVSSEVLVGGGDITSASGLIGAWQDRNQRSIERLGHLLSELRAGARARSGDDERRAAGTAELGMTR